MLKEKLREMRQERNLTQEAVAEYLGVSAQTVSKWERGLLSPDIMLLPKIAVLFHCSIDSIFDMESSWSIEHQNEFLAKIQELNAIKDFEGVYRALIREIELRPDEYSNYTEVMMFVLRQKMFDDDHVKRMILLTEYAERYCVDDDIRNEIHRIMLQICSQSLSPDIKEKAKDYYKKLPMLRHSREVYAKFVMEGDDYRVQTKKNIMYTIDLAECAIRQLITLEMTADEELYYYKKSAELYEVVLDEKYGGFYDVPLLSDYAQIVSLLMKIGEVEQAEVYVSRILGVLEKHLDERERQHHSELLCETLDRRVTAPEKSCKTILDRMLRDSNLEAFKERIGAFTTRYYEHFSKNVGRSH